MKHKPESKKLNKGCIDFVCVNVAEREAWSAEFPSCAARVRPATREPCERPEGVAASRSEDRRTAEALRMLGRVSTICRPALLARSCPTCGWTSSFGGSDLDGYTHKSIARSTSIYCKSPSVEGVQDGQAAVCPCRSVHP